MKRPQNIHCLALNFPGVGSTDNQTPLYFVKSRSAFCASASQIRYPSESDFFWTEVELGIVLSRGGTELSLEEAEECIEGVVVCADLSCMNLYDRDHHLAFSKSRAQFCPTSDRVVSMPREMWGGLRMTTEINGRLTQSGSTADMFYGPLQAVRYLSRLTHLEAGDLIITGTPAGWRNNELKRGDAVRHEIEHVGELYFDIT